MMYITPKGTQRPRAVLQSELLLPKTFRVQEQADASQHNPRVTVGSTAKPCYFFKEHRK